MQVSFRVTGNFRVPIQRAYKRGIVHSNQTHLAFLGSPVALTHRQQTAAQTRAHTGPPSDACVTAGCCPGAGAAARTHVLLSAAALWCKAARKHMGSLLCKRLLCLMSWLIYKSRERRDSARLMPTLSWCCRHQNRSFASTPKRDCTGCARLPARLHEQVEDVQVQGQRRDDVVVQVVPADQLLGVLRCGARRVSGRAQAPHASAARRGTGGQRHALREWGGEREGRRT